MHGAIPPLPQYAFMAWFTLRRHGSWWCTSHTPYPYQLVFCDSEGVDSAVPLLLYSSGPILLHVVVHWNARNHRHQYLETVATGYRAPCCLLVPAVPLFCSEWMDVVQKSDIRARLSELAAVACRICTKEFSLWGLVCRTRKPFGVFCCTLIMYSSCVLGNRPISDKGTGASIIACKQRWRDPFLKLR
jgi:hypothetical protein